MRQPSKNFGNQDNIVDTIWCMKNKYSRFQVLDKNMFSVILIRKFGSRNLYVWKLDRRNYFVGPCNICIINIHWEEDVGDYHYYYLNAIHVFTIHAR